MLLSRFGTPQRFHPKNVERDAQHYYEQYREFFPEKKKFFGVKLKELPDLEHLYEVNISVYSLEPTKPDGEEGDESHIHLTQVPCVRWGL